MLERERGVRERAAAKDQRRDDHVHDLCCLEATMGAILRAAEQLAGQWSSGTERDDKYATPPSVSLSATHLFAQPVKYGQMGKCLVK